MRISLKKHFLGFLQYGSLGGSQVTGHHFLEVDLAYSGVGLAHVASHALGLLECLGAVGALVLENFHCFFHFRDFLFFNLWKVNFFGYSFLSGFIRTFIDLVLLYRTLLTILNSRYFGI